VKVVYNYCIVDKDGIDGRDGGEKAVGLKGWVGWNGWMGISLWSFSPRRRRF
jgi:hypothetical protein